MAEPGKSVQYLIRFAVIPTFKTSTYCKIVSKLERELYLFPLSTKMFLVEVLKHKYKVGD